MVTVFQSPAPVQAVGGGPSGGAAADPDEGEGRSFLDFLEPESPPGSAVHRPNMPEPECCETGAGSQFGLKGDAQSRIENEPEAVENHSVGQVTFGPAVTQAAPTATPKEAMAEGDPDAAPEHRVNATAALGLIPDSPPIPGQQGAQDKAIPSATTAQGQAALPQDGRMVLRSDQTGALPLPQTVEPMAQQDVAPAQQTALGLQGKEGQNASAGLPIAAIPMTPQIPLAASGTMPIDAALVHRADNILLPSTPDVHIDHSGGSSPKGVAAPQPEGLQPVTSPPVISAAVQATASPSLADPVPGGADDQPPPPAQIVLQPALQAPQGSDAGPPPAMAPDVAPSPHSKGRRQPFDIHTGLNDRLAPLEQTALSTGTPFAASGPGGAADPASAPRLDPQTAVQVVRQVSDSIAALSGERVVIRLDPEELGRVQITLSHSETGLTVSLQSERSDTSDLMRRHIDLLGQELRDMGYRDVSFAFGDQPGEGQPQPPGAAEPDPDTAPAEPSAPDGAPISTANLDIRL